MHIVDANVLLSAVNDESELHLPAIGWLDAALAGGATVGFDWTVLLAFTRISTMSRVFDRPLSSSEALAQVRRWLDAPGSHVISPSSAPRSWPRCSTQRAAAATSSMTPTWPRSRWRTAPSSFPSTATSSAFLVCGGSGRRLGRAGRPFPLPRLPASHRAYDVPRERARDAAENWG